MVVKRQIYVYFLRFLLLHVFFSNQFSHFFHFPQKIAKNKPKSCFIEIFVYQVCMNSLFYAVRLVESYKLYDTKKNNTQKNSRSYWSLMKVFLINKKIPLIPPLFYENPFHNRLQGKGRTFQLFLLQTMLPFGQSQQTSS